MDAEVATGPTESTDYYDNGAEMGWATTEAGATTATAATTTTTVAAAAAMDDGAVTDAMEAEVAARSTDSTDCDVDDAAVARRGASETEPSPKRHKAGQVTTDGGTGRATEAMDVVQMDGAGGKTKRSRRGKKKTGMCRSTWDNILTLGIRSD